MVDQEGDGLPQAREQEDRAAGGLAPEDGWQRRTGLAVRVLIPGAVVLALMSILVAERVEVSHDLHLIAPRRARPGTLLPVRTLLFGKLQAIDGPALLDAPVRVELLAKGGEVLAEAPLKPSLSGGAEALLALPDAPRQLSVRATAALEDGEVGVQAPVTLVHELPDLPTYTRQVPPLQQRAAGPLRLAEGEADDRMLEVRIVGGACVPEHPCEALVYVGDTPVALHVEGYEALTLLGDEPAEARGIQRLRFVTHGPESHLRLRAERGGRWVARRRVRLPLALAASTYRLASSVPAVSTPTGMVLSAEARSAEEPRAAGVIVDAYRDGAWLRTGTWIAGEALPFAALDPGIWRIQWRRDPYDARSAIARLIYVRAPAQPDDAVLREVARAALRADAQDRFAASVLASPEAFVGHGVARVVAFLLAPQEARLALLPDASRGRQAALARLEEERVTLRSFALVSLLLSGIALALVMARRGLDAAAEARQIMSQAGDPEAESRKNRLRMALTVWLAVISVLLAFCAIAVYVLARGSAL